MAKQNGSILMTIAVILVIIASLATAFVAMAITGSKSSESVVSAGSAYDLAMAGIEQGSHQLSLGTYNSASTLTPGVANLNAVYCNSTTDCLAVGGNIAYRYLEGAWTAVSTPAGYTLNGISGIPGSGTSLSSTVLINQ